MAPAMTTVTVDPTSAVPLMTGVLSLVSAALLITGMFGGLVSTTRVWVVGALVLPAVSRAVTETMLLPLALIARVPEAGVAVQVLMDQVPLAAVVVE